jgi:hypothetical protein
VSILSLAMAFVLQAGFLAGFDLRSKLSRYLVYFAAYHGAVTP